MNLLIRWGLMVLALVIASFLVGMVIPNGLVLKTDGQLGIFGLFVGVALLALANSTLGSLAKLLLLPLNCMTLGLLSLVINGLLFWWVGTSGWGFQVSGFWAGLLGSVLYSAANGVLSSFLPDKEELKERKKRKRDSES